MISRAVTLPYREYIIDLLVALSLLVDFVHPGEFWFLVVASSIGAIPNLLAAGKSLYKGKISIDVFNFFAVLISFLTGEYRSFAFIVLMLSFARLLDWKTSSETSNAIEELLKLKPSRATRMQGDTAEEINIDDIKEGDILMIKNGERVPVDGLITYGSGFFNEASVTGESKPIEKFTGDMILGLTLNESGAVKMRAVRVGKDSTIDKMIRLVSDASKNKSRGEKLADRFAEIFLPVVALVGVVVFAITKDIKMVAAIFLVACADDIAVSIPLAMTAAIGNAAKRGVIVKGGEWLDALSRINTLVFDKTGTLTYGMLSVTDVSIEPWMDKDRFWQLVAVCEKFSEHSIGRALFHEAVRHNLIIPDPVSFKVYRGAGVVAESEAGAVVAIGDEKIFTELNIPLPEKVRSDIDRKRSSLRQTSFIVLVDNKYAGIITVSDNPRLESINSIKELKKLGIKRVIMLTGDSKEIAEDVANSLGITEVRSSMTPETKVKMLEELLDHEVVGMVGDGINDAPSLARADVGIAMGNGGTAVAVEAADVVILTDDLSRIPEVIILGRQTMMVIRSNTILWFLTNLLGFGLVFAGIMGPAIAAFYNFFTDFLPLINSSRLFKR